MIFISVLILIVVIAIPSFKRQFSPIFLIRISSIIFLYTGALSFNAFYIQLIGSGIGIYSGLLFEILSNTLRLNFIAFRINSRYKLNLYFLFFLFICIISSIILRTNLINEDLLLAYFTNHTIKIIMNILSIFAIIYSLKLIFDIILRSIQAFKIIPEFITLYKSSYVNINFIISFYYIQNILFIMLSL